MKTKTGRRFVIRTILLGGLSIGINGLSHADETSPLDPPIVPPALLTQEPEALPDLPAPGEVILDAELLESDGAVVALEQSATEETYEDSDRELIKERYANGAIKIERQVALDENGNYVNDGYFRMYSEDAKLLAEGQFVMGVRDGAWRRIYKTGEAKIFSAYPYSDFQAPFISKAQFSGGNLSESWTITDAQGKIVSEIPFRDGLRHGKAVWNHPNGNIMYEATYNDGMLQGKMAEYGNLGEELSNFNFENGRRHEKEVEHHSNQQLKAEYEYLSAQQELKERDDWWEAKPAVYEKAGKRVKFGKFTEWHPNGQKKATGTYRDDHLSGEFSSWYANGQRETRGQYATGTPQGQWTWWHENGMRRAQGSYANGTPDGEWTSWSAEGKLAKRQTYSDAVRRGSTIVRSRQPSNAVRRNNSAMQNQRPLR